jgi:heme exporter protein B
VIWAAALLAALLPVERLVTPDAESGVLDQLVARGHSDAGIAAAKMLGHWLGFGPALLAATCVAAALLHVPGAALQPGQAASVLYLPQAPQYNSLYPHP